MLRLTALNMIVSICMHPTIENRTNTWTSKDNYILSQSIKECGKSNLLETCVNRFRKVSDDVHSFTCRQP